MASVASQLVEEIIVHAQNDSLKNVREICADGTYFPNNLRAIAAASLHCTNTHILYLKQSRYQNCPRFLLILTKSNLSRKQNRPV